MILEDSEMGSLTFNIISSRSIRFWVVWKFFHASNIMLLMKILSVFCILFVLEEINIAFKYTHKLFPGRKTSSNQFSIMKLIFVWLSCWMRMKRFDY
jgi:hypothetical protein